jgi:FMN phosphatase YigB (HAD superfamily)
VVQTGSRNVRGVLLDVDGTLYHQFPIRVLMAAELMSLPIRCRSWSDSKAVWKAMRCFRKVREQLREIGRPEDALEHIQYQETARKLGCQPNDIRILVEEWIHRRPLKYLKLCARRGVKDFFLYLADRGVRIGVFSDYPVCEKLQAMGLFDFVSVALCSTDPDVNAFKPHKSGFQQACRLWGLDPAEVLYIGDRENVDAVGATGAGLQCAILMKPSPVRLRIANKCQYKIYTSFGELQTDMNNLLKGI